MTALFAILSVAMIAIILVQIGKVTELASKLRGEEAARLESNDRNGQFMIVFMVLFLIGCVVSAIYYKDSMLGYGPHQSASAHGGELDSLFNVTLFFTGIVFVITHILLFWFSYKYRERKNNVGLFMPHNNTLELVWTLIPAVVMSFLVIRGLVAWNAVMADIPEGENHIEIEATGMQFAWIMRYPGEDGVLGTKDFRKITAINQLGQDWEDTKNLDDIVSSAPGEIIKLPIGQKVRVRITARDVLHNFDIPHFRVKMDAIPGLPTYFVFEPNITTEDYREKLGAVNERTGEPLYPEWHDPYDPEDPEMGPRWENFHFELACAELCGKGHYSMRRIIEVVSREEWEAWMAEQKSFYFTSVRNTEEDPYAGTRFNFEKKQLAAAFKAKAEKALASANEEDKIIRFDDVTFETGSARLSGFSTDELDNLVSVLNAYPNMRIEVAGHTDNTGNADSNLTLSDSRAKAVYNYLSGKGVDTNRLTAVGYGQTKPVDTNDTDAGRQKNRRTEFKILTQ